MFAPRGSEDASASHLDQPAVALAEVRLVGDDALCLGLAVAPLPRQGIGLDEALEVADVVGRQVILVADDEAVDVLGIQPVPAASPVSPKQLPERESVVQHRGLQVKPGGHDSESRLTAALEFTLDEAR